MGAQPHDRLCAEARRMSKRRTINGQFTHAPDRDAALAGHARVEPDRASHPGAHRDRTRQTRAEEKTGGCRSLTPTFASTASTTTPSAPGFGKSWRLDLSSRHDAGSLAPPSIARASFGSPICPPATARPTDEWRSIGTIEEAEAIAQKARASKPRREWSFNQRRKKFRVIASGNS